FPVLLDPILDIVSAFRKVSTESDQCQPEGFTFESGQVVNPVIMPDRHAIVVFAEGGIRVLNLKRPTIRLPGPNRSDLSIDNPLNSLLAYAALVQWCRRFSATLFQTQLLAYSDVLMINEGVAPTKLAERHILAIVSDKNTNAIHHVLFDVPVRYNLATIAGELFALLQARNKKIEAMLNLDTGARNVLELFDENGAERGDIKGPVDAARATNLLVYEYAR
ncbi:MAG: hypothetical protein K2Y23_13025, partial [Cyanobacteria bacterium]|nr:hypothetical protein [Cyanobacteriota bacterium]